MRFTPLIRTSAPEPSMVIPPAASMAGRAGNVLLRIIAGAPPPGGNTAGSKVIVLGPGSVFASPIAPRIEQSPESQGNRCRRLCRQRRSSMRKPGRARAPSRPVITMRQRARLAKRSDKFYALAGLPQQLTQGYSGVSKMKSTTDPYDAALLCGVRLRREGSNGGLSKLPSGLPVIRRRRRINVAAHFA
jgi:hypothetical protein